jgi:hypothetical protein
VSALDEIHLTKKWREADKQVQELKRENEQLRTQLAEFERRQQIGMQNSYEEGYEAGYNDSAKLGKKR